MDVTCNESEVLPSAPDLILDLLGAHGAALSVQALCRAGELFGIAESAIRVGLTRLAREHKIRRCGRGQYAYTGDGLGQVLGAWQDQDRRTIDWDGHWIAVYGSTVPRADKTAWRHHNLALALRGFAEFQPGLQIRPGNLSGQLADFHTELLSLGLSPDALLCRLVDLGPQQQRAACELWNVRGREAEFARCMARLERSRKALGAMAQPLALRESLLLGRATIAFLLRDPMLPPQLMSPAPRQALVQAMLKYQHEGRQRWQAWLAS